MSTEDLRVVKTRKLIHEAFLSCLEESNFLDMSVRDITEHACINRSTFYKHYQDKYDLRDRYVNSIIEHFVANLDTSFISLPEITNDLYFRRLRLTLLAFQNKKREYMILWNSNLQERNVYEEMIMAGAEKLMKAFEEDPDIDKQKRPLFSFYARSFLSRMMVSVRWWFSDGAWMDVDECTRLMIQHMGKSLHATLRGETE